MDTTLFDQLRQLQLPLNGYAIFGSGPLAIRGIIPACNDLDILCKQDVWDIVSREGVTEFLPEYDVTVASFFDGAITFGSEWGIGEFNVVELIDTAEMIDSLPFVRLEYVVWYKRFAAPQCTKDIESSICRGKVSENLPWTKKS